MTQPNPMEMQKFLGGVDYPCSTDELVEHAKKRGANEDILRHLRALPDRTYNGPNAVSADYVKTT